MRIATGRFQRRSSLGAPSSEAHRDLVPAAFFELVHSGVLFDPPVALRTNRIAFASWRNSPDFKRDKSEKRRSFLSLEPDKTD